MTREPIEVTRQDRIFCLKASSNYHSEVCEECKFYPNCDHMTQDDMAELTIKDLEALEQEPCEDAISREKTLTAFADYVGSGMSMNDYDALWNIVAKMPPVNPHEPKTGHWIRQDNTKEPLYGWYFCSECNSVIGDKPKFCSNCGARMEDKE